MGNEISVYNQTLEDIEVKHINLPKDGVQFNTAVLKHIMDEIVLPALKADWIFKHVFQEVYYSGSFYDGLRISEASEFDLNLIFRLPFDYKNDLILDPVSNTFGVLSLTDDFEAFYPTNHSRFNDYKNLKFFLDKRTFNATRMHRLFIGFTNKMLNKLPKRSFEFGGKSFFFEYSVKDRGPAHTLKVNRRSIRDSSKTHLDFEVDLVPVFEYQGKFLVPKKPFNFACFSMG